ncbi:MAG: hypothetical protein Q8O71_03265 [bacterium]|nr:hypothetical protein [bacterium]
MQKTTSEHVTLDQAVVREIEKRIDVLEKYRMSLSWWRVFHKAECSASIQGYQEHLESYKKDIRKEDDRIFNPLEDQETLGALASPAVFDS